MTEDTQHHCSDFSITPTSVIAAQQSSRMTDKGYCLMMTHLDVSRMEYHHFKMLFLKTWGNTSPKSLPKRESIKTAKSSMHRN